MCLVPPTRDAYGSHHAREAICIGGSAPYVRAYSYFATERACAKHVYRLKHSARRRKMLILERRRYRDNRSCCLFIPAGSAHYERCAPIAAVADYEQALLRVVRRHGLGCSFLGGNITCSALCTHAHLTKGHDHKEG